MATCCVSPSRPHKKVTTNLYWRIDLMISKVMDFRACGGMADIRHMLNLGVTKEFRPFGTYDFQ